MHKSYKQFLFNLIFGVFLFSLPALQSFAQQGKGNEAATVIHLLSYVAMDYPGAVQNGKVINDQEFAEQTEFSGQAYSLSQKGKFLGDKETAVLSQIKALQNVIRQKGTAEQVAALANKIQDQIIQITGIQTVPNAWPNIQKGRQLYVQTCAPCHGDKGDGNGTLAANLDPKPANFLDRDLMSPVSPYQAFNTIRLGVPGTSMRAFSELSEQEAWDLAFYVKSLPFSGDLKDTASLKKVFKLAVAEVSLKDVANLSDDSLMAVLGKGGGDPIKEFEALRLLKSDDNESGNSLPIARENLKAAVDAYNSGNISLARTKALNAYLEGIEPVEARLRANSPDFVLKLENQMLRVRQTIERNLGSHVLQQEVDKAMAMINDADHRLGGQNLSYLFTFLLAGSIMLREGLEAFLVLAVVLALIKRSGVKRALPWLHGGWLAAIVAGVAGWFFSDYIIRFGGKNREIMEGLVSLFAVAILLYAGYWLHDNSHGRQWSKFIHEKIERYLSKDKMFGLAAFSFMVVFREAFEVILFFQAINLDTPTQNKSAIGFGSLAALLCIAIMAFFFLKYSKKIPMRQMFLYSAWVIVILAVVLLGKGIHALQESGWINVTSLNSVPTIDWLGVYPTLQSVVAQLVVLGGIISGAVIKNKKLKRIQLAAEQEKIKAEAEKKSTVY